MGSFCFISMSINPELNPLYISVFAQAQSLIYVTHRLKPEWWRHSSTRNYDMYLNTHMQQQVCFKREAKRSQGQKTNTKHKDPQVIIGSMRPTSGPSVCSPKHLIISSSFDMLLINLFILPFGLVGTDTCRWWQTRVTSQTESGKKSK